jgi:hypothetical protein
MRILQNFLGSAAAVTKLFVEVSLGEFSSQKKTSRKNHREKNSSREQSSREKSSQDRFDHFRYQRNQFCSAVTSTGMPA